MRGGMVLFVKGMRAVLIVGSIDMWRAMSDTAKRKEGEKSGMKNALHCAVKEE